MHVLIKFQRNLNGTHKYIAHLVIDPGQEDDDGAVVVPHHPPEVAHCRLQGVLGQDELIRVVVTLITTKLTDLNNFVHLYFTT